MIVQPIKVETNVISHFRVIFTEKIIFYNIFMFQGHSQGQKVNFKVNHIKNVCFFKIKLETCVIPHFYGIFTVESIYCIILMIQGHLGGQEVNFKVMQAEI